MHKDTKFSLVACERHDQPKERMLRDLTQNQSYADTVVAAAHRFFCFDLERVRFSGFAREHDDWDGEIGDYGPAFYVQVWHNAQMVRQVGIRSLGILGTLHVEVLTDQLEQAVHQDYIGAISASVNQVRNIDLQHIRDINATMDEHFMYLEMDMAP